MQFKKCKSFRRTCLAIISCAPMFLHAAEIDYAAAFNITSYDNVNLVRDPPSGELSTSVRGLFSYSEDTSEHVSRLNVDVEFLNYKKDQLDDQVNGALTGESTLIIKPSFFEWYFSNVFARVTINPLAAASSNNLINTNAFLTGPNFYFRFNESNNLNLNVRAENYIFEEVQLEEADNNRLTTALSYVHSVGPTSELSLNGSYSIVVYKNETLNSNFDRTDGFLGFQYQRGLYDFNLEAGVTNILFEDDSIASVNQPRYLLSIQGRQSRTSTLALEAFQRTTDTSTSLLDQLDTDGVSFSSSSALSDLYRDTGAGINYRRNTPLSLLSMQLSYLETRYNTQKDLNVDVDSISIEYDAFLNTTSSLQFRARFAQSSYTELSTERVDDDLLYSVAYRMRLRRTINLRFSLEDESRDSTVDLQSYDDFRIRISIEYVSI